MNHLYGINTDIMDGMFLCVTCTETIPYINYAEARAMAQGTFMGTYRLDQQKNACDWWVRGEHPTDFHEMQMMDIPTLILSGEIDPVTPPQYGEELAGYLPNSLHVVMPNAGHEFGSVWEDCFDDVVAQFISQGSLNGLDASCVDQHVRPPFVSWRDYETENSYLLSRDVKSLAKFYPKVVYQRFKIPKVCGSILLISMAAWFYVSAVIAPALVWIFYFYYKDRFQPEPWRNLGLTYLLGLVSAFACIHFFKLLPYLGIPEDPSVLMEAHGWPFLFYSIGITGVVEETFKFLPFLLVVLRLKEFDEKIDGIVYASVIALGFASYENARYLAYMEGFELFGRAIASPLTHTIFSSVWGYTVGVAHMKHKSVAVATLKGLALAAVIHGLFNFFTSSSALRIISSLLILVIWVWRIRIIEKLRSAPHTQPESS